MNPEHERFLLDHVQRYGFMFIIDRLKGQFPDLGHEKACSIRDEFKDKHAEDASTKEADSQLKKIGHAIGDIIRKNDVK